MTDLETTLLRPVPPRIPMIVAVFSYRYDAALVPALVSNITPMVHGMVSCDDRKATTALTDDNTRRNRLHSAARSMGADWILAVDPDERYEKALADRIGDMTVKDHARTLWVFNLCEMFSQTTYRTDGIWGNKTQMRLYPASATLSPLGEILHSGWVNIDPAYSYTKSGLNLYHLRHASPARAQHRRDTYAAADPMRRFQPVGYDYLVDMRAARLTQIRPGRHFEPAHVEDHGLWASPRIADLGDPVPDPIAARLNLMSVLNRQSGADGAAYVAEDIWTADPDDTDMQMVAAQLALLAGRPRDAVRLAVAKDQAEVPDFADVIGARAYVEMGEPDKATAALAGLNSETGQSNFLSTLHHLVQPQRQDITAADARWRRWAKDGGRIHEGPRNGTGKLAVIVIGFRSPATLARAVETLRTQSPDVEIVVVNSGGGAARDILRHHLDHIRLIEIETPLFVGAARNIGIDGSRAAFVAFLAADCIALPGWVDGRLARHSAGALMVSSAVQASQPGTIVGEVCKILVFPLRSPTQNEDEVVHYGRSYCRTVFAQSGMFAPLLRVGEDTEFHARTDILAKPVWAPEVMIAHDDPPGFGRLLLDFVHRGQRAAFHLRPRRAHMAGPRPDWVNRQLLMKKRLIRQSLQQNPDFGLVRGLSLRLGLRLALKAHEIGLRRGDRLLSKAVSAAAAARSCAITELDRAIRLATEAADLVPQDATYHLLLAELLLKRGAPDDGPTARGQLETVLGLSPTAAHALWLAATALRDQGQPGAALALCEDAAVASAGTSAIVLVAARAALWAGKPRLSMLLAQQALSADPASIPAHQFLEILHRRAGRLGLAERRQHMATCLLAFKSIG